MLKLMEKDGYIKRVSVENDARLKKIVLTDKAIKLIQRYAGILPRGKKG